MSEEPDDPVEAVSAEARERGERVARERQEKSARAYARRLKEISKRAVATRRANAARVKAELKAQADAEAERVKAEKAAAIKAKLEALEQGRQVRAQKAAERAAQKAAAGQRVRTKVEWHEEQKEYQEAAQAKDALRAEAKEAGLDARLVGGKPAGARTSRSKGMSARIDEMVLEAAKRAGGGGNDGVVRYLEGCALGNKTAPVFLGLLKAVMERQAGSAPVTGPMPISIRITSDCSVTDGRGGVLKFSPGSVRLKTTDRATNESTDGDVQDVEAKEDDEDQG